MALTQVLKELIEAIGCSSPSSRIGARFAVTACLLLVLLAAVIIFIPKIQEFLNQDQCLDSGGRWNTERFICEK